MKKQKQWRQNPKTDYPSDVSDEEWALVAPYLTVMEHKAPQREYSLRWIVRAGAPWRMIPNDLPPLTGCLSTNPTLNRNGVFETIVQDLHMLLRLAEAD
jgi:transposase